jgi:hypothetical protein
MIMQSLGVDIRINPVGAPNGLVVHPLDALPPVDYPVLSGLI